MEKVIAVIAIVVVFAVLIFWVLPWVGRSENARYELDTQQAVIANKLLQREGVTLADLSAVGLVDIDTWRLNKRISAILQNQKPTEEVIALVRQQIDGCQIKLPPIESLAPAKHQQHPDILVHEW